jgi:hypothetical protein
VAVELVAGLVWGLGIVFTAFAEDVGADVQDSALLSKTKPKFNKNATATRAKKETTVVAYATTALGI